MMQMSYICITCGSRVPESRFQPKTSSQTRPNPPGDAQTKNVDSLGSIRVPHVRVGVPPTGSLGRTATPVLCPPPAHLSTPSFPNANGVAPSSLGLANSLPQVRGPFPSNPKAGCGRAPLPQSRRSFSRLPRSRKARFPELSTLFPLSFSRRPSPQSPGASRIPHPASRIPHPASRIPHRTSKTKIQ